MSQFPCPYLKSDVDLTEERERHITERHPDLLPEHRKRIAEALADPDQVRRSVRFGSAKLFPDGILNCGKASMSWSSASSSPVSATGSSRHT